MHNIVTYTRGIGTWEAPNQNDGVFIFPLSFSLSILPFFHVFFLHFIPFPFRVFLRLQYLRPALTLVIAGVCRAREFFSAGFAISYKL